MQCIALVRFSLALGVSALIALGGPLGEDSGGAAQTASTPTPYHEGVPVASPHVMESPRYPLPGPQDPASADAMAAGATAMIHMAR